MLELLGILSQKLQPFRWLSYVLLAIFVTVILGYLLQPSSDLFYLSSSNATLSFVGCIWLLLFNLLLSIFDNIPSLEEFDSRFKRFKIKIQRCFYYLLAVLFISLTLVILFLTIRMLRV